MPPTYQQLKLQVWWILSDPGESHDRYLEEYGAFFSEQALLLDVDATFSFGEVCRKQGKNLYEESIYQVDCTIEWPGITWFGPSTKHLQVLINEKNRFVELYLHLKIPPMLMGEVVSDIPARPGSAAAAAPLRWECYLAIGCNCIGGSVRTASLCRGLFLKLVVRDYFLARRVVWRLSQRCAHGTLICYAPIQTHSSNDAAFECSHEVQVHFENRILRKFNSEFAIRMSFRDDNLDKLSFTLNLHSSRDALLDAVVGSFLHEGVRVSTRTWMYTADVQQKTAVTICEWMGQFEGIPNVAKRLACMGQCSSTEQAVRVQASQVQVVPDFVGGCHPVSKKPYSFSDGVGMMSVPLAKEGYDVMKLTDCPLAMQIWYAGSKGMLCINPALPNKKLLCLWLSVQKFPCTSSEYFEVVKVSAPHALVEESSAVSVLAAGSKLPLPYEDLSKAGFQLTLDPFFRSLLLAVYRNAVAGLRYKTRIVLPVDRARNMLGVVGTTNKLRYGEVFVQCTEIRSPHVQEQEPPKRTVIRGTVLVTKCPCLHPGDVRKFTAIDLPELHHVIDCIMFPVHGPRPHPDEMAGSDLDGDEYIVIWEKCLFFVGPNRPPMNFSDRNPEPDNKEITTDDMIKFFCNYIKNDSIGILSNAHLSWADHEPGGIHSPRCLAIAEKIIICLDFAKNGQTAFLRHDERPLLYPDFMEKGSHKTTYRSDRALGVLYRTCRSLEAAGGRLGHRHVDPGRCRALAVSGWENYRESAIQALTDYNSNICRIVSQYGIGSEGDVTKFLTETTRNIFYTDVLKEMHDNWISDSEELRKRKLRRTSAWYMVTYEPDVENTFFSFPWCIADVLVEILRSSDAQARVWCPNILHWKIDQLVANNGGFTEDDDLDAGCDSFRTAFRIVEKWLKDETLLGQHEPGTSTNPGLCSNCLPDIYAEFLGNKNLAPVGKIVMRRWHAMMLLVAEVPNLTESTAQEAMEECADREEPTEKAVSEAWQIVDGFLEPLLLDDSEDETNEPRMTYQNEHVDNQQDPEVSRSLVFPLQQASDTSNFEPDVCADPSVGTLVVSFLGWCLEQHQLPREMCRVGACADGSYECQTHRLPMVALRAYSSLGVSLDPCHVSLSCDPAYHEPHQEVVERDPVRIQIANPVMDQMLKDKLHAGMTSDPSWICNPPCPSRHSKSRNEDRPTLVEPMPRIALGNATAAGRPAVASMEPSSEVARNTRARGSGGCK